MGKKIDVAGAEELADGTMTGLTVEGEKILLVNAGGTYYATSDVCAHLGGTLSKGTLEGYVVTCPRHGSQYDVRTGENLRWLKGKGLVAEVAKVIKSPRGIKSYPTEVKDGRVFVEI